MAARFWVTGGTGNWNDTSNWSTTSGGASGASVPGSADTATLNASSGSGTVTLDISPTIQTLTCTGFTGTLAFGTNTISLNSTGTIFSGATTITVTGTPQIICTNSGSGTRTISPSSVTEANSISFRITAGTGIFAVTTGNAVRDLDFTDGTNPTGFAGTYNSNNATIYGSLKASTGMSVAAGATTLTFAATSGTKTIDTAGVTFDRGFTFNGVGGTWQLQGALTSGSTRACTLTNGTLDLNGYTATFGSVSSSNSNIRTFAFGSTGKFVLLNSGGVTVWTTSTATNLTVTGTNPLIQLTTNGTTSTRGITMGAAGESNAISIDVTAGSDQINLSTTSGSYKNVDFTGFTGTVNFSNSIIVYGNWNFGNATLIGTGTGTVTFSATSGTKTITTIGLTFPGNVTFNGVGGTWSLQDALSAVGTLTLTNGILTTNGYAVTSAIVSSSNTNIRTLNLGASTVTLTGTGTVWNIADPTNITLNSGTSTITTTGNSATTTFAGGSLTYYNVSFGASYYNFNMSGANTFNNLTLASPAGAGRRALTFSGNQTINGTLSCSGSAANSRTRLAGAAGGTTLTVASVAALSDVDFTTIIAAGASSPWSGTRLGNFGTNTNITFASPKTVYWNQPAGGNWSDVAWATSSGGTVNVNNFPLGQDTAVLDNTGVGDLSTIVMDYGWALPSISAGSLTNALTINWNCFSNLTAGFAGPTFTLSSAINFSFTQGALAFNSISNSTITTAGVSFPMNTAFGSVGVTMTLADNLTTTGTVVNLVAGTVDLNGNTLTCFTFDSTFTDLEARAIAFNGGQINVAGANGIVWACENLTNFSYTGTPTVNFTYASDFGTRTIQNGSVAGGTEANAVDFNIVAGGDTVTSSNFSVVRNFTVQSAFTGTNNIFSGGFVYGNLLLSPNQLSSSTISAITFAATSGIKTITTNGIAVFRNMIFDGVGGTWQLQDALDFGSGRTLTLTNGTFDANNYTVTGARVASSNSNVRTLKLGSANWTMIGGSADGTTIEWDFTNNTNLTIIGTGLIVLNSSTVAVFQGGSRSWPGLVLDPIAAGTAERWIYGSNTFDSIVGTTANYTLSFEAGTTQTITTFDVSGTAGNLVTLASKTPGTQFNLLKTTGTVNSSYLQIQDSNVSAAFFANTNSTDLGNNNGWNFTTSGVVQSGLSVFF